MDAAHRSEITSSASPGDRLRRIGVLGWPRPLATIVVLLLHLGLGHEDYGYWERFLAGAPAAVLLNVIWTYFAGSRTHLPVLEWVLLQMYVFFAMPVFAEGASTMSASFQSLSRSGAIQNALLATNLFFVLLLVGWRVIPARGYRREGASTAALPLVVLVVYGAMSLLVAGLLNRYEVESQMAWYRQILWLLFLPTTAQLLLLFEYQRQPRSRSIRGTLYAFTGLMVIMGLFSSRLGFALVPLVTLGIGVLTTTSRLPKRLSFLAILLLILINPAKHVYRQITGYRTADFSNQTLSEMADAWMESLTQTWISGEDIEDEALELTSKRLNSVTINAAVIAWVPVKVKHARGEPWLAIPYSVVPRVLWPNKPALTEITNDKFAIEFGMLAPSATERTTFAYPSIADGYWNFGWFGIGLAAFLAGMFWKLVSNGWSPHSRYRYVLPFFLLVDTRATAALPNLLLGIIQAGIACLVVATTLEILGALFRKSAP